MRVINDSVIVVLFGAVITLPTANAELIWHSPLDGSANAIVGENPDPMGTGMAVLATDLNDNAGGALNFPGEGDTAFFEILPEVDEFTAGSISIWVRPDVLDGTEDGIVAVGATGGGPTQYFSIMNRADNRYRVDLDDGNQRLEILSDEIALAEEWVHLVATFNSDDTSSGLLQLYVDGVLQIATADVPLNTIYEPTNNWLIGTERVNSRFFPGSLDDVRIFNSELTQEEVTALFDAGPLFVDPDDMDGDGLPDAFEIEFGLNPNSSVGEDGAMGDPDGDMLFNIDEFLRSTDPTESDTDFDSLSDLVETNTGIFVDATDTGTDPNDPDTDDDSLEDSVETNTGTFVNIDDTGTNPHLPDTDEDGFLDPVETNTGVFIDANDTGTDPSNRDTDGGGVGDQTEIALGTDPFVMADDTPDFPRIFMTGRGDEPSAGSDNAIFNFLIDNYGFDGVAFFNDLTLTPGLEEDFDLIIISSSSTVNAGALAVSYANSPIPVINWEPGLADSNNVNDFQMLFAPLTNAGTFTVLDITATRHPITDVFATGPLDFTNNPVAFFTVDSQDLAPGVLALGETDGQVSFFVADTGAELLGDPVNDGSPEVAPARRVNLPFVGNTFGQLTADGVTLFERSIEWALGNLELAPLPVPIAVSLISYDEQTGEFSLTWESEIGVSYEVESSPNLEVWTTVTDIPIVATEAAIQASFTQDPTTTPRLFYRVVEVPSPTT